MGTEELVTRAQGGDRDALCSLFELSRGWASVYARGFVPDLQAAQDAVQDAFVYAVEHLPELHHPGAFEPWLREIIWRRCRHGGSLRLREATGNDCTTFLYDVEPRLMLRLQADEIREVGARLPEHLRKVFQMHHAEGLTLREISRCLTLTMDTVRTRLHTARLAVRRYFDDGFKQPTVTLSFWDGRAPEARAAVHAEILSTCYTFDFNTPSIGTRPVVVTETLGIAASYASENSPATTSLYGINPFCTTMIA